MANPGVLASLVGDELVSDLWICLRALVENELFTAVGSLFCSLDVFVHLYANMTVFTMNLKI